MSTPAPTSSARRKLILALLVISALAAPTALDRYFNPEPEYQPKYQTIAHRFLDLEAKYRTLPEGCYELLDHVIAQVQAHVRYDPKVTDPAAREKQLLTIFRTIDSILISENFIFPPGRWNSTLGEALYDESLNTEEMEKALQQPHNERRIAHMKLHSDEDFRIIACGPNAFLYMGIAEAMGFELKPVMLPKHVFVRAQIDSQRWINWDPNRGRSISDEEYFSNWGVADWQVRQKIFMHPLADTQIEAEMYASVGAHLGNHAAIRGFAKSIECYRKALELNPRNLYALNNLALNLMCSSNPDPATQKEALELVRRVLDYQPNEAMFHLTFAYVLATSGQTQSAAKEMEKAIELDPQEPELREMLPLIQSGHTMYSAFQARRPIAFWIGYQYGWLYILIFFFVGVILSIILLTRLLMATKSASISPAPPALVPIG